MKTKEQKRSVGKWTPSNILFNILNYAFLTFLTIICLYPMLHVLFASVSNPTELIAHQGLLLKPIGFTLSGYQHINWFSEYFCIRRAGYFVEYGFYYYGSIYSVQKGITVEASHYDFYYHHHVFRRRTDSLVSYDEKPGALQQCPCYGSAYRP